MTREELAAELERLTMCGSAAGLLFLCRDNLRTIVGALRAPTEAQVERTSYAVEQYFGPVCGETGEWCLIPGASPREVARAALLAAREP